MLSGSLARRIIYAETFSSYLLSTVAIALAFFIYARRFQTPPMFSGDAEQYWKLGATFFPSGSFSFLAAEQTLRGYLLPLIFGVLHRLGASTPTQPFVFFYGFNSLFTAWSLVVVMPLLFVKLFDVRIKIWQIFLLCILFFTFWRGYLVEPLADSWSLFLVLSAILAITYAAERSLLYAAGLAFVSGACLAAAINFRPIYLICLPIYAGGIMLLIRRARSSVAPALFLGAAAGHLLVLVPQIVINQHFAGSWNPFAQSGNLYVLQLFFGLAVRRHECAYFVDPSGVELLKAAGIASLVKQADGSYVFGLDISQRSIGHYLELVLGHPVDAALIYVRHVVNGITLLGSNIYRCSVLQPRYLFNFASMMIILIAATAVVLVPPRLRQSRYLMLACLPLFPVLLTIPTAMEGRFFLPVHLGAYAYLCFLAPWRPLRTAVFREVRIVAPTFIIVALLAATQIADTFAYTFAVRGESNGGVLVEPMTVLLHAR